MPLQSIQREYRAGPDRVHVMPGRQPGLRHPANIKPSCFYFGCDAIRITLKGFSTTLPGRVSRQHLSTPLHSNTRETSGNVVIFFERCHLCDRRSDCILDCWSHSCCFSSSWHFIKRDVRRANSLEIRTTFLFQYPVVSC